MWIAGNAMLLGAVGCSLLAVPVELNAIRREFRLLEKARYLSNEEMSNARAVLRAAGWSYVAVTGTALVGAVRDMIRRGNDRT
jgi:Zn-dependent membrane protease YugP